MNQQRQFAELSDRIAELFDSEIILRDRRDGYLNGAKMCRNVPGKQFTRYFHSARCREDIKIIAKMLNISESSLCIRNRGNVGTYIHPLLAARLCMWLSPLYNRKIINVLKAFPSMDFGKYAPCNVRSQKGSELVIMDMTPMLVEKNVHSIVADKISAKECIKNIIYEAIDELKNMQGKYVAAKQFNDALEVCNSISKLNALVPNT